MTDYTDMKRRIYVLTGAAREPNVVADPLEDAACKALDAIAALEAEVDALRDAKRVAFEFDGKGWILRADLSDMPIAFKAGDVLQLYQTMPITAS